jgi:CDP-paratose 2-epimerase
MRLLITGGAGFIGCNAAAHFIQQGHQVVVLDNLSRRGSQTNLDWLHTQGDFDFEWVDIRNYKKVVDAFQVHRPIDAVLHLAAQVAVTTSVTNPRDDFEVNALGTFNVLEALRCHAP